MAQRGPTSSPQQPPQTLQQSSSELLPNLSQQPQTQACLHRPCHQPHRHWPKLHSIWAVLGTTCGISLLTMCPATQKWPCCAIPAQLLPQLPQGRGLRGLGLRVVRWSGQLPGGGRLEAACESWSRSAEGGDPRMRGAGHRLVEMSEDR